MTGRSQSMLLSAVLAGALALGFAPAAGAQTTDTFFFEHDDSLDGTPDERQSGFFSLAGNDPADPPALQRATLPDFLETIDADDDFTAPDPDLLFEAFEFEVAPGDVNGSFTVQLNWGNPNIDFDMYVYRQRPNGTVDGNPIAQGASGDPEEHATYVPPVIDSPVEPGTYVVVVDNWCSSDTDPIAVELYEDVTGPICDIGAYEDEDDFSGRVEFQPFVRSNRPPQVSLAGPDGGTAGQRLTFRATATDEDGSIAGYAFDLDGDGNFEYDNARNSAATRLFDQPGVFNIGVRVIDDRGGVAYASKRVTITGTAVGAPPGAGKPVSARNLLSTFRLNRPVFGGRSERPLIVRYRLRDRARVTLSLYRGRGNDKKLVKRIIRAVRREGTTYKHKIPSRGLRRGNYSVRIAVRTSDGRRKVAWLHAKLI